MNKYTVETIRKVTKTYLLTYELELDHYPTEDDIEGYIPVDEEYDDEEVTEKIISVEN